MQRDPKTKRQFDAFVANGMRLVHAEKTRDQVIERIKSAETPIQGVADVALSVVDRITAQREIQDIVRIDGGKVILDQVIEVAEVAGIHTFTQEDKDLAFSYAIQQGVLEDLRKGKYTPEELAQWAKQLEMKNTVPPPKQEAQPEPIQEPAPQQGLLGGANGELG